MSQLTCGIVGLPNVGKSTLFNALTGGRVESANYPFCTIDPNVGEVPIPDARLEKLAQLCSSQAIVPATVRFVDIAGLVQGASQGEGLGNQFLSHIRETDALIQVVRCFEDTEITHVSGSVDPIRDLETINLELILSDMQLVENRLQKLKRQRKEREEEWNYLCKVEAHLQQERPLRTLSLCAAEKKWTSLYSFVTDKPMLYVGNVDEATLLSGSNVHLEALREYTIGEGAQLLPLSVQLEAELIQLPQEDRLTLLKEWGMEEPGLNTLITRSFSLLGLMVFFTAGKKESRAWTLVKGSSASKAAGRIHSDFEKNFIRAEVIPYETFIACTSRVRAREQGKVRLEGREYLVQEGDVLLFFTS